MGKNSLQHIVRLILMGLLMYPGILSAQGDLLITPRRVVFEGNKRSTDISLANIGKDTATYSISLVQIRMTENGGFETITEADEGQQFASPYLRFFPRSVTLKPEEVQTVKIQAVRTGGLAPGEYRSHLYFRATPKEKPLGEEIPKQEEQATISINLVPVFGITIPVIIRVGEPSYNVTLSDPELTFENDTIPRLSFVFNRSGNYSVYGDISVDHVAPDGTVNRVGIAKGIAVYTPNATRKFTFNLFKGQIDYNNGKLLITYSAPSDVRPEKYAEATLILK
jgi:P pilus assembly chaperone PapD